MIDKVPFEQQQPAVQAMLQAVMKQLVRNAKRDGLNLRLLQILICEQF
jgi:predicted lipid carrier protein YhbT